MTSNSKWRLSSRDFSLFEHFEKEFIFPCYRGCHFNVVAVNIVDRNTPSAVWDQIVLNWKSCVSLRPMMLCLIVLSTLSIDLGLTSALTHYMCYIAFF